jgi:hypothetical protein
LSWQILLPPRSIKKFPTKSVEKQTTQRKVGNSPQVQEYC